MQPAFCSVRAEPFAAVVAAPVMLVIATRHETAVRWRVLVLMKGKRRAGAVCCIDKASHRHYIQWTRGGFAHWTLRPQTR
jgi:hypothetical protein